jgi:transglutaminase-like putative cysteine protease
VTAVLHAPGVAAQVSRAVMWLVLATAFVAAGPHLPRLPLPVGLFAAAVVGWRLLAHAGVVALPTRPLRVGVLCAGAGIVVSGTRNPLGLEPAVTLLVVMYLLKLLETVRQRDAAVVVLLGYFVAGTLLLFDQSSAMTACVVGACLLCTASLAAQSQALARPRPWRSVVVAARMLALGTPLAAMLFVLFPRVGPLWSVPLPGLARTGLTEEMSPHLISELARSGDVAFRVNFSGPAPPPRELYWRTVLYYEVDGGTWRQGLEAEARNRLLRDFVDWNDDGITPAWRAAPAPAQPEYRYRVIAEPSGRPWLHALGAPSSATPSIGVTRDQRLLHRETPVAKVAYDVVSQPALPADLPSWLRVRALSLPAGENPRTLALARELRAASASDAEVVGRMLDMFRSQDFYYTLTPEPLAAADAVDAFLFGSRRGVCGHYAGSFAYVMRAAGVPARVVGGYQGGETNALGDFTTVRQYDAHAWVEVWLDGGWQRVDPTAAVAPERIEEGVEALAGERAGLFDHPWGLRHFGSLGLLLSAFDSFEHHWNMWVVGYDAAVQARTLARWFGSGHWRVWTAWLFAGAALFVGLHVALGLAGDVRRRRTRLLPALATLQAIGARAGVVRAPAETPGRYGARLALAMPRHATAIAAIVRDIERALYATEGEPEWAARAGRAAFALRWRTLLQPATSP